MRVRFGKADVTASCHLPDICRRVLLRRSEMKCTSAQVYVPAGRCPQRWTRRCRQHSPNFPDMVYVPLKSLNIPILLHCRNTRVEVGVVERSVVDPRPYRIEVGGSYPEYWSAYSTNNVGYEVVLFFVVYGNKSSSSSHAIQLRRFPSAALPALDLVAVLRVSDNCTFRTDMFVVVGHG